MQEHATRLVKIADPFWSERLEVNARRAIFHQWKQLEASGCIDNFRLLAGLTSGVHQGWFFADLDAYKWLEAASNIYATHPDQQLAALMDELIGLLERVQLPDGYLFTYNQLFFPGQRWVNLQIEHELYCFGHMIEAGVAHFAATAQTRMLDVVIKAANLLVRELLDMGPQYTCGHEEIELALLRLYLTTKNEKYLELARQFLERRGRIPLLPFYLYRQHKDSDRRTQYVRQVRQQYAAAHPGYAASRLPPGNASKRAPLSTQRWYANALSGKYLQQHAPIRQQKEPVGHSVRFGYLETAVAMLHRQRPDPDLLAALQQTWQRMVTRRMYVTGGLGSLSFNEGFGNDYELDPELAYAETCAALASLFWNWQMALITQDANYSDLFEWQLYNAAAVGMGLSGESYLYNNPLTCHGGVTRKPWYAVPCCPSNLSRTWASLGKYIYSLDDGALWIHQYIGNQTTLELTQPLHLLVQSALPWGGGVTIHVDPASPAEFTLHLRLPSWCIPDASTRLLVNGQPVPCLPPHHWIAPPAVTTRANPSSSPFIASGRPAIPSSFSSPCPSCPAAPIHA